MGIAFDPLTQASTALFSTLSYCASVAGVQRIASRQVFSRWEFMTAYHIPFPHSLCAGDSRRRNKGPEWPLQYTESPQPQGENWTARSPAIALLRTEPLRPTMESVDNGRRGGIYGFGRDKALQEH